VPSKIEILESFLPIWLSHGDGYRLDNNFFSPAAYLAEKQIRALEHDGLGEVMPLGDIWAKVPTPGVPPSPDGLAPLIEGANLRPNCIFPRFSKYADAIEDGVRLGDLFITKDGEPGTAAIVTTALLEKVPTFVWGEHVYRVRLHLQWIDVGPYICAFLNSTVGQALIRKTIAGGTTPTIRKDDLAMVPIFIPQDRKVFGEASKQMNQLQVAVLETVSNLGPSSALSAKVGLKDPPVRLPINWAGGGRSDPHNYDR